VLPRLTHALARTCHSHPIRAAIVTVVVAVSTSTATGVSQSSARQEVAVLQQQVVTLYGAGRYADALPLAERVLAIREAQADADPIELATSLNNLAALHQGLGAFEEALPLFQRALQVVLKSRGETHEDTALSLSNLAMVLLDMGAYDRALPLLQQALRINEKDGANHRDTCATLNNLGGLYYAVGAYDQALPLLQRALQTCEKYLGPDDRDTATTLNNLAGLHYAMGAIDVAVLLCERAVQIREKTLGETHPDTTTSLSNLGVLYLASKDQIRAETFFRRSRSSDGLVELLLARGQASEALQRLESGPPAATDRPTRRVQYLTYRGLALSQLGRASDASVSLLEAVEAIEVLRERTAGDRAGFFRAGAFGGYLKAYRALVTVLAERALTGRASTPASTARSYPADPAFSRYGIDLAAAAFSFAESTKARSLLEAIAGAARGQDRSDLPAALRQAEASLTRRLAALEARWEVSDAVPPAVSASYATLHGGLGRQLDELVAQLRREYPLYAALRYPQPIQPADVPLLDGEVLLEYALADEASYLFVVRRGGVSRVVKIPIGKQALEAKLQSFMQPLINSQGQGFSVSTAAELYQLLVAPAGVAEAERLIVVPDGLLGLLPFEALVVHDRGTDRESEFLGDRHQVSYTHSATVLALQRRLKRTTPPRTLFALGNPVFSASDPRYRALRSGALPVSTPAGPEFGFHGLATRREWGKTGRDDKQGRELVYAPLPETEQEVTAVARILGVPVRPPDVLVGVAANETTLRASPLGDYRYLHFATHADLPGKVQGIMEPFLVLGQVDNQGTDDGLLTLNEVLALRLTSDLVVLSACVTGRGTVMDGEGVVNFARAFEHAGSRSVVVSLWEVASLPAVEFMTDFYGQLSGGQPRLEALRHARSVIKAKYPNPFYWAVFVLHGEG